MTKANKSEIVFVVDRSGSMERIAADMRGGFDAFIAEQRKVPGECAVTLAQFDNEYEVVYQGKPIADVPPCVLEPRGGTALLDAIGRTIVNTGTRLRGMREHERPSKVFFVIVTDGEENASRVFRHGDVLESIKHQRDVYGWEFVFLGADENAISVAASIGIRSAAQFTANGAGARALYSSVSAEIGSSRATGMSVNYNQAVYDSHKVKQ
jgi:hypothetical protein